MSALADASIHAFINENRLRTSKGNRFTFDDHLFLFDVYSDFSPELAILKPAQIGASEMQVVKVLWAMRKYGIDVVYTMPTRDEAYALAGSKVNRLIANNPVFQQLVKDRDTIEQKTVGANMLYFKGTHSPKDAITVPADWLCHDETDSSRLDVIADYQSRLQHSKFKWTHWFSHPSSPGAGVDQHWRRSDMKEWFVKCSKCAKEQFLEWPESICRDRRAYVCKACSAPLSEDDRRVGRWVSRHSGRSVSGYHISLLMAPWVSAGEIVDKFEAHPQDFFFNKVLGLPYEGGGNRISEAVIYRNCTMENNLHEEAVIGVDVGLVKHFVVGNAGGLFRHGTFEDWAEFERLLKEYPRSIAVIDAMPDLTEPRRLRDRYPGRVFLCSFARDRKGMQLVRWGKKDEDGHVLADRNRMIQLVVDEIHKGSLVFSGMPAEWRDYAKHWATMYRVTERDATDKPVSVWKSTSGVDHYCLCTIYWRIALDRFGGEAFVTGGDDGGIIDVQPSVYVPPGGMIPARPPLPPKSRDWRDT